MKGLATLIILSLWNGFVRCYPAEETSIRNMQIKNNILSRSDTAILPEDQESTLPTVEYVDRANFESLLPMTHHDNGKDFSESSGAHKTDLFGQNVASNTNYNQLLGNSPLGFGVKNSPLSLHGNRYPSSQLHGALSFHDSTFGNVNSGNRQQDAAITPFNIKGNINSPLPGHGMINHQKSMNLPFTAGESLNFPFSIRGSENSPSDNMESKNSLEILGKYENLLTSTTEDSSLLSLKETEDSPSSIKDTKITPTSFHSPTKSLSGFGYGGSNRSPFGSYDSIKMYYTNPELASSIFDTMPNSVNMNPGEIVFSSNPQLDGLLRFPFSLNKEGLNITEEEEVEEIIPTTNHRIVFNHPYLKLSRPLFEFEVDNSTLYSNFSHLVNGPEDGSNLYFRTSTETNLAVILMIG